MGQRRKALILANYEYEDPSIRQLIAPSRDAEALARVLEDSAVGGFEVQKLINEPSYRVMQAIESFFADSKHDDLLLLYFSGHGMKDEEGRLYFVTKNTRRKLLRSSAVSAKFVNDIMHSSRSRKQVLLLDCCYSGAFARGLLAKSDKDICVNEEFEGRGKIILTASNSMQYSFEGDDVEGKGVSSIFTRSLVGGLESGKADEDANGSITIDELYNYVYNCVYDENPLQRPTKTALGVEGDIVIAKNPKPVVKLVELPQELQHAIESPLPSIRLAVVNELERLLNGSNRGLALSAHKALKSLIDDDSRSVSNAGAKVLEAYGSVQDFREESDMIGLEYRLEEPSSSLKAEIKDAVQNVDKAQMSRNAEPKWKRNCPSCDARLTIQARFCPNCGMTLEDQQGAQILQRCPKCKLPIKPGSLFCVKCGHDLKGGCPKCGSKYKDGALFCSNCGLPL